MNNKIILTITFIFLSLFMYYSHSQVLGIDFGTQFWKASLISPGRNLAIVENSRSQRKTHNSISFHQGVRYFQSQTLSKRLRKPLDSHFYLNRLIRSLDQDNKLDDYKFEKGTYIIAQDDRQMTLEQVVAMILRNLKFHASQQAGSDIKDCVIAIPANWGPKAKMAIVNAANIAQMSVLGLMNQNTAAITNFAITRNDTNPVNMVVFNLGSANLQISVIKLFGFYDQVKGKNIQSVQVVSHHVVDDVGGLTIDQHIANYLASQFKKKHKIDPKQKPKSWIKLLHKSSDVKQVLSANKQTMVFVQGLIDGIDLQQSVKRQVIEQMQLFNKFPQYIQQAIKKSGLTTSDISFVQIIGGASRVPRVSNIVKQFFAGKQVGAHMNGDQSMAFGAALRAANLSIAMKVKQLHLYDGFDFDTRVVISSAQSGVIHQGIIFTKSDQHGSKKSISLSQNDQQLKISIYKGQQQLLRQYTTSGLIDWKQKYQNDNITGQPEVVLNFVASSIYVAQLKEVYVNITLNITQIKEKVQYVDEKVQVEVQQQKKEQQAKQQGQQKNANQDQQQVKDEKTQEAQHQQQQKQQQKQKQDDPQQQKQKVKKTKKQTITKTIKKQVQQYKTVQKKHTIKFQESYAKYPRISKQQAEGKRQIIKKFEKHEQYLKDRSKIRNQLQSTLYSIKNNFQQDILVKFSTQDQLTKLKDTVHKQIQWMDQNAYNADKQTFQEHFNSLYKVYQRIYNRTTQYQRRQKAYNQTMGLLSGVYMKTQQLNLTNQWLGDKIIQHLKRVNKTVEQINSKIKKQINKPLNQDPIIYNHQMINMAEQLKDQYYLLRMIPRPRKTFQKPIFDTQTKQDFKDKENVDETIDLDDQKYQQDQNNEKNDNQEQDEDDNNQQQNNQENNDEQQNQEEQLEKKTEDL